MSDPRDSTGIRVPPPLVFAAGLAGGLLLDRVAPLAFLWVVSGLSFIGGGVPIGIRLVLAAPFVLAGLALDVWAMLAFRRARTTVLPWGRASLLVPGGPYRFSRNPMYVGMTLVYVGLVFGFGSPWALLLLVPVLLVIRYHVVAREERHLEARFGEEYLGYKARVRRWL